MLAVGRARFGARATPIGFQRAFTGGTRRVLAKCILGLLSPLLHPLISLGISRSCCCFPSRISKRTIRTAARPLVVALVSIQRLAQLPLVTVAGARGLSGIHPKQHRARLVRRPKSSRQSKSKRVRMWKYKPQLVGDFIGISYFDHF